MTRILGWTNGYLEIKKETLGLSGGEMDAVCITLFSDYLEWECGTMCLMPKDVPAFLDKLKKEGKVTVQNWDFQNRPIHFTITTLPSTIYLDGEAIARLDENSENSLVCALLYVASGGEYSKEIDIELRGWIDVETTQDSLVGITIKSLTFYEKVKGESIWGICIAPDEIGPILDCLKTGKDE